MNHLLSGTALAAALAIAAPLGTNRRADDAFISRLGCCRAS
jgi:hypothetical protein